MENKKIIKIVVIIVLVIILALLATFTTIYFVKKGKLNYEIENISEYNYSIFYKDEKYGVINKEGEIVVEPTYSNVQIPNPSKALFICISDYDAELGEYSNKILNDKKEQILTTYDKVSAISVETTDSNVPYEKTVLKYKKDGKYGLIDFEGKEITKPIYDEITGMNYKEGTLLVKQDEKYGVININGATIIKSEYASITADNYYDEENQSKKAGFIVSEKTDEGYRYGYIAYNGKQILKNEYTNIERINEIQGDDIYFIAYKNGQAGVLKNNKNITKYEYEAIEYNLSTDLFIVQKNSKKGIINKNGDIIVNTEYEDIYFGGEYINAIKNDQLTIFNIEGNKVENNNITSLNKTEDNNYYIAIDEDNLYTILDANKNNLLDETYDYIEYFGDNKFFVTKEGNSGIIDNNGNILLNIEYNSVIKIYNTNVIQAYNSNTNEIILFNKEFQEIGKMKNGEAEKKENYILLSSDSDFEYYDNDGNKIEGKDIFTNNKIFACKQNGKWGFQDSSGKIVVECIYDMVTEVNEYGYAGIEKDGKWGSVDANGTIVQEPTYKLQDSQPMFIKNFYKIESWTGENCYSDNQVQEEADNEVQLNEE